MREQRIEAAREAARRLVFRFGVRQPEHLRIEAFAEALGVRIFEARLEGAGCQLIRQHTRGTIVVPDHMDRLYRRFGIAHELGHFVLRHPIAAVMPASHHPRSGRDYELEANAFASELLMPEHLIREAFELSKVDLDVPRQISARFDVSLLASSIRFTELASERCAAVFSRGGRIQWVRTSAALVEPIPQRTLARTSLAYSYFERGELEDKPTAVPAGAWFDTSAQVDIVEHSTCSAEFATVLSMLWVPPEIAPMLQNFS